MIRISDHVRHAVINLNGKVNRRCREIPHGLSEENAQRRIDICKELLKNPLDRRLVKRIVAGDEKWIYFTNPHTTNQWLDIDLKKGNLVRMVKL